MWSLTAIPSCYRFAMISRCHHGTTSESLVPSRSMWKRFLKCEKRKSLSPVGAMSLEQLSKLTYNTIYSVRCQA